MNKAEYVVELVEAFGVPPEVRAQVQRQIGLERGKFRRAQTGTPVSHALKVIKELDGVTGFRPDQNMTQRPTIGMDAEYDKYDPNPESRWDPEFRKQAEARKTKAGQLLQKNKSGMLVDPETGAPLDPETGEPAIQQDDEQQAQAQQQDPNADPNQQQQDPAASQQAGQDPNAQQDLDPNAATQQQQAPPELPELPVDQRKDPSWKGHIPAPKDPSMPDASQRVVSRYDKDVDPLKKKPMTVTQYQQRQNMRRPQTRGKTGNHGPVQKYWS